MPLRASFVAPCSQLVFGLLLGSGWCFVACGDSASGGGAAGATAAAGTANGGGGAGGSAGQAGMRSGSAGTTSNAGAGANVAGSPNVGGTSNVAGSPNVGGAGGAPSPGGSGGTLAIGGSGGAPNVAGSAGTAGSIGSSGGAGGASGKVNGSIVPLYTYPSDGSWAAIITAAKAHPSARVIAIINPDSGPGANADASFNTGASKLIAAGIVPIGYVSTNYSKRGEPAVKADIDKWHTFYPTVPGIFFDEQSIQAGDETFYRDVSKYAKSKGMTLTVGNPGTGVPDSYLDTVDIMLCYESAGVPTLASLTKYAAHREHFGIIPYAAKLDASYVKSARSSVAYVFITGDDLPNPWDTLPDNFGTLLDALTQ